MKRKLTALLVMAAMLLTLMPVAAFAASNYSVTANGFDTEDDSDYVLVIIDGSNVTAGQRVICYMDNVDQPVYTGVLERGQNILYIDKDDMPDLSSPYSATQMTVTITNAAGNSIAYTTTLNKEVEATNLSEMTVELDDSEGVSNRELTVKFDEDYVPDSSDQIRITGLNVKNSQVGTAVLVDISGTLEDKVDKKGMRTMNFDSTMTFSSYASSIQVEFLRNGTVVSKHTKTLSLASKYGTLDYISLEFNNSSVKAGETVTGTLYFVNTDGKRYDISDEAQYIYAGTAVAAKSATYPQLTVSTAAAKGDVIRITAYYNGAVGNASLTVGDGTATSDIGATLSRTSASIDKDVAMTLQLVDENGNAKTLDFTPTNVSVRLTNTSASANVELKVDSMANLTTDGTMSFTLNGDTEATGQLVFTFTNGSASYTAKTGSFRFREVDAAEKRTVRMGIGSIDLIVNGEITKMDVAPFIYQDRTMVPLRALVEAFGAEVGWNGDTRTITIDYEDTTVIMQVGNTSYTVNGVTKTLDAAPYIASASSRTLVPVRFVAEALGFTVTPSYYDDGTTADVLFEN